MIHKLTDINHDTRRAICSVCGPTKIKTRDKTKPTLAGRFRCKAVYLRNDKDKRWEYTRHKKDFCQGCLFKPEHSSQLDVDHIDGNRHNNNPDNLQTLCANCHRLKTHINRDYDSGIFQAQKKKPPTQDFS